MRDISNKDKLYKVSVYYAASAVQLWEELKFWQGDSLCVRVFLT